MKHLVALILIGALLACTANLSSEVAKSEANSAPRAAVENKSDAAGSTKPIKSPHGYIITKDYKPGGFGGFIGDCSDDKNWPYYWQCMSENSGNGFK